MKVRLDKDEYQHLKHFKKEIRKERIGKFVRDHRGRIYRIDENGSFRRATRDDLIIAGIGSDSE